LGLFFELVQTIYLFIGSLICPNGVCAGTICALSGTNPCSFDIYVFSAWLGQILTYLTQVFVQIVRLTLAFLSNLLNMIIFNVVGFAGSFGFTLPFLNGNTATLESVIPASADPQTLADLNNYKTLLLYLKDRAFELIGIYVRFFTGGFIMGDTIICNTIFDFINCIASKTCYALAYAGLYIFDFIGIKIPLDFRIICRFVGLFLEKCSCDVDVLIPYFVNSRTGCVQVQKVFFYIYKRVKLDHYVLINPQHLLQYIHLLSMFHRVYHMV
jgi:hypothetical protein